MNLESLSFDELKQRQKDVAKAIETFEARQLAEARAKLEAMAAEMGVTLAAVVDTTKKPKRQAKPQGAPKYRHPDDPSVTWTGRGRKPTWFVEAIESGASTDDLKI